MTYSHKSAVWALNSYVLKLLLVNLEWDLDDYSGAKPIIPAAQQPEMMESGKPFLVYGHAEQPSGTLYALRTETVAYTVYASNISELENIVGLIVEALKRQDEAAADVNDWLDTEAAGRGLSRSISFSNIRVTSTEVADPADQEGGFFSALIMVAIKYTTSNYEAQTSGFTY